MKKLECVHVDIHINSQVPYLAGCAISKKPRRKLMKKLECVQTLT
jgi:hypothetical protein